MTSRPSLALPAFLGILSALLVARTGGRLIEGPEASSPEESRSPEGSRGECPGAEDRSEPRKDGRTCPGGSDSAPGASAPGEAALAGPPAILSSRPPVRATGKGSGPQYALAAARPAPPPSSLASREPRLLPEPVPPAPGRPAPPFAPRAPPSLPLFRT